MTEYWVCPGCATSNHDRHTPTVVTGFQIPDTNPMRARNRMIPETRPCECPVCTGVPDE